MDAPAGDRRHPVPDGAGGRATIRLLESPLKSAEPLEEHIAAAGWNPADLIGAAPKVEFENTSFLGLGKKYVCFNVPHGGLLFPGYDLNHAYEDCDTFVSIGKMKEHLTAGVTLSMKTCFGITPCTIYGDYAGVEEPGRLPQGGRYPIHTGYRAPSKSAPQETDPASPREGGYRVPRCVADLRPHGRCISRLLTASNRRPTAKASTATPGT